MKLNFRLLLIAVALVLQLPVIGQTYERTRHLVKSFAVKSNTEIQVNNKYGNIHLVQWEKDSVKFEIELLVKGNKQSKLQKNFDMIEFDFTATAYYVIAQTNFNSSKGAFWDEVSDLANTIFSGTNRVQIDYRVYIPKYCSLKIENKFGNVYIGDQTENADIKISNGDLKANDFFKELKLKLDFGNASIRKVKDAEIIAGYSEIEIKKAETLTIDSKSSTFELGLVNDMQIESHRDKMNIEEIGTINGKLSFSDLKIDFITGLSILISEYGSIEFKDVAIDFNQIHLTAKFTEIDLNFDSEATFKLEITHSIKTDLSLPATADTTRRFMINDKQEAFSTLGNIGSGKNLPTVSIEIESGRLAITNY